jgi:hypothetical protein
MAIVGLSTSTLFAASRTSGSLPASEAPVESGESSTGLKFVSVAVPSVQHAAAAALAIAEEHGARRPPSSRRSATGSAKGSG